MIVIQLDDEAVRQALQRLMARLGEDELRQAWEAIGGELMKTTKQRFASSTAPDGSRWAPNARSTMERLLGRTTGGTRKDGRISAKGSGVMMGKRPLVDTGHLADTIRWQPLGGGVAVGTDCLSDRFAGGVAVHQFGSRNGHIPARPFLGLSTDDRAAILEIVAAHLDQ